MKLSIVMPVLNEAARVRHVLRRLAPLRAQGHELICVDGGSGDGTAEFCEMQADAVIRTGQGRARQMNAGAASASGAVLLFLHADTALPERSDEAIARALRPQGTGWGCFRTRLTSGQFAFRVIETMMDLRTCFTGMVTGDKAMFVRRDLFHSIGGFPDQPLMEDIAISRRLKRHSRPICLPQRVLASSRYWEQHGIVRSVVRMWGLRMRYFLGADPATLARVYYGNPRE